MSSSVAGDQSIPDLPESNYQDYCASKNIFKDYNKVFQEITIIKRLNKAKFPVYLVQSKINNQIYAMKAFPYENGKPDPYYQNEIRFSQLRHCNITQTLYYEHERRTKSEKGLTSKLSYKIMEYAPHGDLYEFIMTNGGKIDEKLARTYFKHLIEGLEYLHKNGISHMDIKLENLLIDDDYRLKIVDFDLSHSANDAKVISKGTKFYRAPELKLGRCNNPMAADIYSAGIILFALKTQGTLPHAEDHCVGGINFSELLHNNDSSFWHHHSRIQGKEESFFDQNFKELFQAMTQLNSDERPTIETIKRSQWYAGPSYSLEELRRKMKMILWD